VRVVAKSKIAVACCLWLLVSATALAAPVWVLKSSNLPAFNEALSGFRKVYPSSVEIDSGKIEETLTKYQAPSLIVAIGPAAAIAARQKAPMVPLVFLMVPDPVRSGLGGTNVGGISMDVPLSVQLSGFKELVPDRQKRIAIVYNPARSPSMMTAAQSEAKSLNLFVELVPAESSEQIRLRFTLIKPLIGAIWVIPDESFVANDRTLTWFKFLVSEATELHVPLFVTMNALSDLLLQEGALAGLVADPIGMGEQCGELVKEIEGGHIKIDGIGLKAPQALYWELNRSMADKIGLKFPDNVLKSARFYPRH